MKKRKVFSFIKELFSDAVVIMESGGSSEIMLYRSALKSLDIATYLFEKWLLKKNNVELEKLSDSLKKDIEDCVYNEKKSEEMKKLIDYSFSLEKEVEGAMLIKQAVLELANHLKKYSDLMKTLKTELSATEELFKQNQDFIFQLDDNYEICLRNYNQLINTFI